MQSNVAVLRKEELDDYNLETLSYFFIRKGALQLL